MAKKLILDYTPEYDFLLFAIVSFEQDYRLAWDINRILEYDFVRTDDYSVYRKKSGTDLRFSSFIYTDPESYINYRLISNNSTEGMLIGELKGIDFLLIVSGEFDDDLSTIVLRNLQRVDSVQNIFSVEAEKLRGRDRLLEGLF